VRRVERGSPGTREGKALNDCALQISAKVIQRGPEDRTAERSNHADNEFASAGAHHKWPDRSWHEAKQEIFDAFEPFEFEKIGAGKHEQFHQMLERLRGAYFI
jgi:hypothetical protein